MQSRQEVTRSLFVARGDGAKLFDILKETLDQISLGI
jgi:hypothetical protein